MSVKMFAQILIFVDIICSFCLY